MPKVLVLDAQMRNSLAIIRSLGKEGLEVDAGEETKFATGFFSKFCNRHIVYPSPTKRADDLILKYKRVNIDYGASLIQEYKELHAVIRENNKREAGWIQSTEFLDRQFNEMGI